MLKIMKNKEILEKLGEEENVLTIIAVAIWPGTANSQNKEKLTRK